jgi:hypothetical protein
MYFFTSSIAPGRKYEEAAPTRLAIEAQSLGVGYVFPLTQNNEEIDKLLSK